MVSRAIPPHETNTIAADDLDRVNEAFFNTNAAISLILLAVGTIDCLWL